jgi:hypothetical protein
MATGQKVYDSFGTWTLDRDEDGNWLARQGQTEILLLEPADFARFGLGVA